MVEIRTLEVTIHGNAGFTTDCYLVRAGQDTDSLVVIDPGDQAERILQVIGQTKVDAIIITHGHFDHIGAVGQLARETGATVYAHCLDAESIRKEFETIRKGFFDFSKQTDPSNLEDPIFEVTAEVQDLDIIVGGGLEFQVIHTPGHSHGSICLYLENDGILFSGDTLFYGTCGRTDFDGGSPAEMHDSLARLSKFPLDTVVYPGHGPTTTIANELNRGLAEY